MATQSRKNLKSERANIHPYRRGDRRGSKPGKKLSREQVGTKAVEPIARTPCSEPAGNIYSTSTDVDTTDLGSTSSQCSTSSDESSSSAHNEFQEDHNESTAPCGRQVGLDGVARILQAYIGESQDTSVKEIAEIAVHLLFFAFVVSCTFN